MSRHVYAVEDYGLLLDHEALMTLSCQVFDKTPEDVKREGENNVFADLMDHEDFAYVSFFSGETLFVDDHGNDAWTLFAYECDTVYFVPVRKYPSLFAGSAPYKNVEELVKEFREVLGGRLPNYDIRNHICHIIGTQTG